MEPSTLAEILRVEKDIRDQLDVERERAQLRVEQARQEIEREHRAALERLQSEAGQRREAALKAASAAVAARVESADAASVAVAAADDDELRALLRRGLAVLLPGEPP